jgi:CubicO group peptidase (beta-lactamase class C family)
MPLPFSCAALVLCAAGAVAAPQLAAQLGDADLAVAGRAAAELGRIGEAAFPAIRAALASGTAQQRWGATVALYRSTADIEPFVPVLAGELAQSDERIVMAGLGALARLGPRAAAALPALKPLLAHDDADVRGAALGTLGAIGPAAADLAAEVEPFLRDGSAALRIAAADALRQIRPPVPLAQDRLDAHISWLRENVPALMREAQVPGVSIAIVQRGEVAWAQGFGVSDARSGRPVTTETVFEAASMSKPILALVAVQLVREGRLDLERPLVEYLGRDSLPDVPAHRRVTARMALTHRTGFPNWRAGYDEMGGPLPLRLPPGSEYTYSGEGILFLQRAIESIADAPLDRLARERLFAPLGLARTSFVWTEALEADFASGHRDDGRFKERTRYLRANAAYSLYTTPTQYARLILALRQPEFAPMLARELRIDDAAAVVRPGDARSVATYRALGWSLEVTPEGDIAEHSGSNSSGFKAFGQLNPAKGSGLVIFANGDGGYRVREAIVAAIGDL